MEQNNGSRTVSLSMSVAAWWLAAACALAACGDALADLDVTWPGCSRSREETTMEVVQPGQTNTNVTAYI
ncbi:hypothetical protein MSG28_012074 [Choristoneura fumiferana]|uniref:Uncharacterized protein n=1 Tax=Choristoneura fumiferana TaxID=7141 RepID=A0ACC0KNX3_CHOFU|nr:hypothetical protein MSG28_012074 [Choristoneura fumiferana]